MAGYRQRSSRATPDDARNIVPLESLVNLLLLVDVFYLLRITRNYDVNHIQTFWTYGTEGRGRAQHLLELAQLPSSLGGTNMLTSTSHDVLQASHLIRHSHDES